MLLLEEKVVKDDADEIILEEKGVGIIKVRYLIVMILYSTRMDVKWIIVGIHGT